MQKQTPNMTVLAFNQALLPEERDHQFKSCCTFWRQFVQLLALNQDLPLILHSQFNRANGGPWLWHFCKWTGLDSRMCRQEATRAFDHGGWWLHHSCASFRIHRPSFVWPAANMHGQSATHMPFSDWFHLLQPHTKKPCDQNFFPAYNRNAGRYRGGGQDFKHNLFFHAHPANPWTHNSKSNFQADTSFLTTRTFVSKTT